MVDSENGLASGLWKGRNEARAKYCVLSLELDEARNCALRTIDVRTAIVICEERRYGAVVVLWKKLEGVVDEVNHSSPAELCNQSEFSSSRLCAKKFPGRATSTLLSTIQCRRSIHHKNAV